MTAVVAVPANFWLDHSDRAPYNEGERGPDPIGRRGRAVLFRADDPGLALLLADAEFYADPAGMDECPRYVRESARRTVAVLLLHRAQ